MKQPKINFEEGKDITKSFPLDTNLEDSMFPGPKIHIDLGSLNSIPNHEEIRETLEKATRLYYKNYYVTIIGMYLTSERLREMEESFKNTLLSGLSPYLNGRDFNVKVACEPFRRKTNYSWSSEVRFDISIEVS